MQKLGEYNQTTKGMGIRNTWQLEISNHEWWNRGWKPTGWRSCSRHHYIDGMLGPKTSRSLIHFSGPFQSTSKAQVRLLALGPSWTASFGWNLLSMVLTLGHHSSLPGNSSSWSTWLTIPAMIPYFGNPTLQPYFVVPGFSSSVWSNSVSIMKLPWTSVPRGQWSLMGSQSQCFIIWK